MLEIVSWTATRNHIGICYSIRCGSHLIIWDSEEDILEVQNQVLEETECTAAWCSVDNWKLLICGVYFYGELKESNEERQVIFFFETNLTM